MNSFSTVVIEELTAFCKGYLNECLHENKGYNIIHLIDQKECKFDRFLSLSFELGPLMDLDKSKEESASSILYAIKCSDFRNYDKDEINITGNNFTITFDKSAAVLSSYKHSGMDLIIEGPTPNFWRAPIDNDNGGGASSFASGWRRVGLFHFFGWSQN